MLEVKIGNKIIGEGKPTFIIAEVGSNHDRKLKQAKMLVDVAKEAGVDAVKFQTFSAETLYSKKTPKLSELRVMGRSKEEETVYDVIKRIELPREWQAEIADYCKQVGITFLSTPYDERAVDGLDALNVPAFKVSSYDLTNLPFLNYIAKKGKPILLSTGTANLGEIEDALNVIRSIGNQRIILLHCVSQYPARFEDLNLRAIETMRRAFQVPIGFSDHTMRITASLVAVALGACIIERHFTLSRKLAGPDHPTALEPDELKMLVEEIRNAEKSLGSPVKHTTISEMENRRLARRSIHAKVDIPEGTTITKDMLIIKRPALGIQPKFLDIVIGRKAREEIKKDEWITWDMI